MGKLDLQALLELPQLKKVNPIEKVGIAERPDTSTLTGDQKQIADSIMDMIAKKGSHIYLIKGYAGTGKTYLTSMLMEMILSSTHHKVAVTAPTNKAVKVLKAESKFSDQVLNLRFSTIHSLLGLREKIDGHGRQTFVKMRDEDVKVGEYSVIFIDEVSMFSDELFEQLIPYLDLFSIKLIFIGDPAQIPPVNATDCIPFTDEGIEEYQIEVGELTKVLRQAESNPIIQITMKIRKALGRDDVLPIRENKYDPITKDGVYFLGIEQKKEFYKLLKTYFDSENFKQDADFCKIICYTNKTVDTFNRKIRRMIYGADAPKLCIGEKLIAHKPIMGSDDTILYSNNDEFEVLGFEVVKGDYKGAELWYYQTIVRAKDEGEKTIKIIHEKSQEDYQLILDHLVDLAKAEKRGSWDAAKKWQDFYRIQEVFADVKYNYAITAHKSQGSTYDNVFVMELDININFRVKERNRIKYTAFTRPKNKLFIVS